MPEHVFTVAARGLTVDAQTNTLTLFAVLEEIGAPHFPAAVFELGVVTLWRRMPGEEGVGFVQQTRFIDPSGEEIAHLEQTFRFDKPRQRMIGQVHGFPIRTAGCHRIEVLVRRDDQPSWGEPEANYPIEVTSAQGQAPPSLLDTVGHGANP
jgi:hypothetical protein